jgi:ferrous iron transport protein B
MATEATTASTTPNRSSTAPRVGTVAAPRFALLGNPNTGKTTLFNQLCGIRARTANFPGSTVEARIGSCALESGMTAPVIDLPGAYSLDLAMPESQLCRDWLDGRIPGHGRPDALVIVVDATNLPRNLVFAAELLRRGIPAVLALNMTDLAQRRGLTIDAHSLSQHLDCPVVAVSARSGAGIDDLVRAMSSPRISSASLHPAGAAAHESLEWAERIVEDSVGGDHAVGSPSDSIVDRLDAAFTHPVLGFIVFIAVMAGLFGTIFWLAAFPMTAIEWLFGRLGSLIGSVVPAGALHDLLVDGVVAGIAGTVVFLPQICLLFFLISLLEDTGYLARAAFVMDRLLRRFGLPGQSFVPLLSAHACAIPALMSTRLIPDHRDRLATILVAPMLSCSARLPVYVLLIGILFGDRPVLAGVAFVGCYALGALAAMLTALIARKTVLRGEARPMVLELPSYKWPSIRNALLTTIDRAMVFLRKAGTVILGMSIVLWWLSAYPQATPPLEAAAMESQASQIETVDPAQAESLVAQAEQLAAQHQLEQSFIGRLGRAVEPIFAPLGYDWRLSIGVLTSFAAREVFVSTMSIILAAGSDDVADPQVIQRIQTARRDDGVTPVLTTPAAASLLVFYVLAMQCLPTLAVTRRETGSWKWAGLQFGYMTALAWVMGFITYRIVGAIVPAAGGAI